MQKAGITHALSSLIASRSLRHSQQQQQQLAAAERRRPHQNAACANNRLTGCGSCVSAAAAPTPSAWPGTSWVPSRDQLVQHRVGCLWGGPARGVGRATAGRMPWASSNLWAGPKVGRERRGKHSEGSRRCLHEVFAAKTNNEGVKNSGSIQ